MNDEQLLRYSRHILLPEIGVEGQQRWLAARVLVVGIGGLGSPAALYLAAAGVGTIVLSDPDVVEPSNLQRQILHRTSALGSPKVDSASAVLAGINPDIERVALHERLEGEALDEQVALADVVLDCSDNFPTRYALNLACVRFGKPLVSGTANRFEGYVSVFDLRTRAAPCYGCLFPEGDAPDGDAPEDERCAVMGVFAPLTGIVGAMQAAEALKLLANCGEPLTGRLLVLDALAMQWHEMSFERRAHCTACAARPDGAWAHS